MSDDHEFVEFVTNRPQKTTSEDILGQDPRDDGELCQDCGRRYSYIYHVPDDLWAKIRPNRSTTSSELGGLLCIECAVRRAREIGIELYFDGEPDDWLMNKQRDTVSLDPRVASAERLVQGSGLPLPVYRDMIADLLAYVQELEEDNAERDVSVRIIKARRSAYGQGYNAAIKDAKRLAKRYGYGLLYQEIAALRKGGEDETNSL